MPHTAVGKAIYAGFSCQLHSAAEEEFARNALQTGGIRHDGRPLHLIKPYGGKVNKRWMGNRKADEAASINVVYRMNPGYLV